MISVGIRLDDIDKSDICIVNLDDDAIANEKKGERPCIVVALQKDVKFLIVIPLTKNLNVTRFPFTLQIKRDDNNNLDYDSVAEIFQIRAISYERVTKKIGFLETTQFTDLQKLLSQFLDLNNLSP